MSRATHILVLDVGTTGIKALVFDDDMNVVGKAYGPIKKDRPRRGWVEQDPAEILRVSKSVMRRALMTSKIELDSVVGIGITNQREAVVAWDAHTGKAIYPMIGWEDRRTAGACRRLRKHARTIREETGLSLEPYFSSTKIAWLLEHAPNAADLHKGGRLRIGTIDSWLVWHLCSDHPHVTDETNAARTLLFNIKDRQWSPALLEIFGVSADILPTVLPSRANFGILDVTVIGKEVPVLAVCGDQQSSAYAALRAAPSDKPMAKITYGTGTFVVQPIGDTFALHKPFYTTLMPDRHGSVFALEGKVEGSGEAVAKRLSHPKALRRYLASLAKAVDKLVRKLPQHPTVLVADGGVIRDGIVTAFQQERSGIPVLSQPTFDGTALGTALLVRDAI